MNTSLSHLPEYKQKQLGEITRIIVKAVSPEKVILFGSHATGRWVEHRYTEGGITYEYISDYDILVITPLARVVIGEQQVQGMDYAYEPPYACAWHPNVRDNDASVVIHKTQQTLIVFAPTRNRTLVHFAIFCYLY